MAEVSWGRVGGRQRLGWMDGAKEEEVRGERTEETNASTLVRVTSRVTISPKIHCEQTQM